MALKAKKPEAVQNRLKMFVFSDTGVGKTTWGLQFPSPYIIDGEKGTSNYKEEIDAVGGVVLQTSDIDEVIDEVRSLTTEKHEHRTLLIDPITMIEADLIDKAVTQYGEGDMRVWSKRDRQLKRLVNLLYKLDMNVIVTAHSKPEYAEGGQMKKIGMTFDAWKRWPYVFDLCIELQKQAGKRLAFVKKTRIRKFKDGESFPFSYDAICERFDRAIMERSANAVVMASVTQVARIKELLEVVAVPKEDVMKWLSKAGVDEFADMNAADIGKCIDFLQKKFDTFKEVSNPI